jgi:hypothetical protein
MLKLLTCAQGHYGSAGVAFSATGHTLATAGPREVQLWGSTQE